MQQTNDHFLLFTLGDKSISLRLPQWEELKKRMPSLSEDKQLEVVERALDERPRLTYSYLKWYCGNADTLFCKINRTTPEQVQAERRRAEESRRQYEAQRRAEKREAQTRQEEKPKWDFWTDAKTDPKFCALWDAGHYPQANRYMDEKFADKD